MSEPEEQDLRRLVSDKLIPEFKEVLEWYADPDNWYAQPGECVKVWKDTGTKARAVLGVEECVCPRCGGTGEKSPTDIKLRTLCAPCKGTGKLIHNLVEIECYYCHGTGQIVRDCCNLCEGTGRWKLSLEVAKHLEGKD